jgi:hypothetical protein
MCVSSDITKMIIILTLQRHFGSSCIHITFLVNTEGHTPNWTNLLFLGLVSCVSIWHITYNFINYWDLPMQQKCTFRIYEHNSHIYMHIIFQFHNLKKIGGNNCEEFAKYECISRRKYASDAQLLTYLPDVSEDTSLHWVQECLQSWVLLIFIEFKNVCKVEYCHFW